MLLFRAGGCSYKDGCNMNDLELLRRYRETRSEEAFRELVDRHLGMVYAVALRQVRNPDSADELTTSWTELIPLVFEALDVLSRKDRDAILMRFIENRSFAEVAVAMGTSEAAAKMRTGRALEKLRDLLDKRGSSLTLATLSAGLAGAASAAPS